MSVCNPRIQKYTGNVHSCTRCMIGCTPRMRSTLIELILIFYMCSQNKEVHWQCVLLYQVYVWMIFHYMLTDELPHPPSSNTHKNTHTHITHTQKYTNTHLHIVQAQSQKANKHINMKKKILPNARRLTQTHIYTQLVNLHSEIVKHFCRHSNLHDTILLYKQT